MAENMVPVRWRADDSAVDLYDPVAAYLCAWCSYYSYYDAGSYWFGQLLAGQSLLRFGANTVTGRPQGWAFKLPDVNIVVIAGTSDYSQLYGLLRDTVYYDHSAFPSGALVGSVWGEHAAAIWSEWNTPLRAIISDKPTLFCGHSLGGAIAHALFTIAKREMSLTQTQANAYTFGAPRVGNRKYRNVGWHSFNVVNAPDIVPKLPFTGYAKVVRPGSAAAYRPVWPQDFFVNHGRIVTLEPNGRAHVADPLVEGWYNTPAVQWDAFDLSQAILSSSTTRLAAQTTARRFELGLVEHFMQEYLTRLRRNVPEQPEAASDYAEVAKVAEVQTLPPAPPQPPLQITPPPMPTPPASQGVTPLRARRRH